jgi:biotin carboxyl carrier protein
MMTNLKRQLNEVGMKHRLDEILEEIILVRKDLGYPVMATPYSQIVGVQAMENILSGERYKNVTDEVIKYVMGYYGEPAALVDPNAKDKILSQPRVNNFLNWDPRAKNKPIEEMRQEIDPNISDDDLLLKMLIPGKLKTSSDKKRGPAKPSITKPDESRKLSTFYPESMRIDVDGEVFNVKIISVGNGSATIEADNSKEFEGQSTDIKEIPKGALVSGMTGMIISIKANMGDRVNKGDVLATIEAMKMIREIPAPNKGEIKSIHVQEGDMVEANDILMVVQ